MRTVFLNNKADNGGGIGFSDNQPHLVDPSILKDCVLKLNNASIDGGGMDVSGRLTTVHVSGTFLDQNYAGENGGAIAGSSSAIVSVANSAMTNNAAGAFGGSAFASHTSLTFDNVSVARSVAGLKGGGVALAGDTSSGRFHNSGFDVCNASLHGGALAAWSDVAEVVIENAAFSQCGVEEQGGALHVSGAGSLSVASSSFEDCAVAYSAEPVCLTLTMSDTTGTGWTAELFVFRKQDYHGEVVYGCAETCEYNGHTGSCDEHDDRDGNFPSLCKCH